MICESGRFIFIRIPKNASTSLATYFINAYCDEGDSYTPINDAGIRSQNFSEDLIKKYRLGYRFIHLTLNELIDNEIISEKSVSDKRVIGCLREPLDRQLSLFFFRNRRGDTSVSTFRDVFKDGTCRGDTNNFILQSDYLKIGDTNVGEFWLYENLNEHLSKFKSDVEPRKSVDLPVYKSSHRKNLDKQNLIDEYYDQATLDAVHRYYEKDFELYESLLRNGN